MESFNEEERISQIAQHIDSILRLVGENPERQGLIKTPQRAARALWYITQGYRTDADAIMQQAIFDHEGSQLITVKNIEFYSMCEHHILPFFGKLSIGYVPDGKIVGLSKLARIVDVFAHRLQVQERFTAQVADTVLRTLGAKGVMVVCEGEHMCMKMRGVEKQHSSTTTVHYNGIFEHDPTLRAEFLSSIR